MSEDLDPEKYHVFDKKKRKSLISVVIILILLVLPPFSYVYYKFAVNRPSQTDKELTVEIEKGESVYEIAGKLYTKDIINSKYLFTVYVLATNRDKNIQAGVYTIPAGISIVGLSELLQYGTNDQRVTLLEGWRVEEYARVLDKLFENIDYEDFVYLAKEDEGFLFPDTYDFKHDVKEKDIINSLRNNFDLKTEDLFDDAVLEELGLTKDEVVILASIVEREVKDETDRAVVAGILIKRLKEGMLLGADATTQYVVVSLRAGCDFSSEDLCPEEALAKEIEWWPNNLTQAELDYDNPYNTRKVVGLPPNPICNPSYNSIKAVIESVPTQYYYYLTDKNGITHYAVTLEAHNSNIYRYLR